MPGVSSFLMRIFKTFFIPIGFVFTHLKQMFFIVSIILLTLPIFSAYFEQGPKDALIEAGKQIAIPDLQIKEGMEKLIKEPPIERIERLKIWLGISGALSVFYFVGFLVFWVNERMGEFVWFKGLVFTMMVLAFAELLYLFVNNLPLQFPLQGILILITHPLVFLEPVLPFIELIGNPINLTSNNISDLPQQILKNATVNLT